MSSLLSLFLKLPGVIGSQKGFVDVEAKMSVLLTTLQVSYV